MATKKAPVKKGKKKRKYNDNPETKIKKGITWIIPVQIHPAVAEKIIADKKITTKEYGRIINEKLAEAYNIQLT